MELVELIKKISVNAVEATKPVAVFTGKVTSINPFQVQISVKMVLEDQLIITERIRELIDGYYVGSGTRSFLVSETSSATGVTPGQQKKLSVGDKVILLRVQGGQEFVVIDKVV